ncbi:hypothetical protein LPJ73_008620, partial [Coemansia sp. RSA 2703]
SYLAAFVKVDEGMDPTLRSLAIWTVLMLLESGSSELVNLVTWHPSIVKNIEKIAEMGALDEERARHSAYVSAAGPRVSRAFEGEMYGDEADNSDEADDDIYNRMESLAQDVVALVHSLEQ